MISKDLSGIYCYSDSLNNDKIVYVGKDSHINKNERHRNHHAPNRYNDQPINRILQNNPERYEYHVICEGEYDEDSLNNFEIEYIALFNPKFNFTIGGDGRKGSKLTDETKAKISKAHKGKTVSKETRKKISKAHKGKIGVNKGKKLSQETKKKISESRIGKYGGDKNPRYRTNIPPSEELYMEWKSGISQKELAEKYNCGLSTIQRRIKKVNPIDGRSNQNIPSKNILFNEWVKGTTQKELAEKYHCAVSSVERLIKEYKMEVWG